MHWIIKLFNKKMNKKIHFNNKMKMKMKMKKKKK